MLINGEVFAVWEVDVATDEATGDIHYLCSEACQMEFAKWLRLRLPGGPPPDVRLVLGTDPVSPEYLVGLECNECGVPLDRLFDSKKADRFAIRLVLVLLVLALLYIGAHVALAVSRGDLPPRDCQEDEACWDCSTMGNRICGPIQGGNG